MVPAKVVRRSLCVGSRQAATSVGSCAGKGCRRVGARERVAATLTGASRGADGADERATMAGVVAGIVALGPMVAKADTWGSLAMAAREGAEELRPTAAEVGAD